MRWLLRCLRRGKKPPNRSPDVPALAPLTHLIDSAEPAPDLLVQIEKRIDKSEMKRPTARNRLPLIVAVVAVAVLSVVGTYMLGPKRQSIEVRSNSTMEWVPLGSVTLHGTALRSFVRGKCEGHTHFFITMHGISVLDTANSPEKALRFYDLKKKF